MFAVSGNDLKSTTLLSEYQSKAEELIVGAIDIKVQVQPYHRMPLHMDVLELARSCHKAGMRATVVQNTFGDSTAMAWLANKYVPDYTMIGGYTMNKAGGGFNPNAIEITGRLGKRGNFSPGRIIWFPEFDSVHTGRHKKTIPYPSKWVSWMDLTLFVEDRIDLGLHPQVETICKMIGEKDMVLATEHCTPEQGLGLIARAKKLGVKRFLVTHPSAPITRYTLEQKQEAAKMGAYLEECYIYMLGVGAKFGDRTNLDPETVTRNIFSEMRNVGPEHYCLSTDVGFRIAPNPVESMKRVIALALKNGLSEGQVRIVTHKNPASLLRLH